MRVTREITDRAFVVKSVRTIDEHDATEFINRKLRLAGQSDDWRVYHAQRIGPRCFNVLAEYRHTLA